MARDPIKAELELIDARIETLDQSFNRTIERVAENIEAMTIQVGTFTEGLARLERQVERIATATEQQVEIARQHSETAKIQAENVSRLIALLANK